SATSDQERNAGREREATGDRRQRDAFLLVHGRLDWADVDHLLAPRVRDPAVGQGHEPEDHEDGTERSHRLRTNTRPRRGRIASRIAGRAAGRITVRGLLATTRLAIACERLATGLDRRFRVFLDLVEGRARVTETIHGLVLDPTSRAADAAAH